MMINSSSIDHLSLGSRMMHKMLKCVESYPINFAFYTVRTLLTVMLWQFGFDGISFLTVFLVSTTF